MSSCAYSSYEFCAGYWPKKYVWEVVSPPHSMQEDNSLCGVYVMKVLSVMFTNASTAAHFVLSIKYFVNFSLLSNT